MLKYKIEIPQFSERDGKEPYPNNYIITRLNFNRYNGELESVVVIEKWDPVIDQMREEFTFNVDYFGNGPETDANVIHLVGSENSKLKAKLIIC